MSWKVFRIKPKRIVKRNSLVLTPDMEVTVTTKQYQNSPFDNGAQEVKAMYMPMVLTIKKHVALLMTLLISH